MKTLWSLHPSELSSGSGTEGVDPQVDPRLMNRCSPVCEDVLEADEGLCEGVEFVHGGVDGVETRAAV